MRFLCVFSPQHVIAISGTSVYVTPSLIFDLYCIRTTACNAYNKRFNQNLQKVKRLQVHEGNNSVGIRNKSDLIATYMITMTLNSGRQHAYCDSDVAPKVSTVMCVGASGKPHRARIAVSTVAPVVITSSTISIWRCGSRS